MRPVGVTIYHEYYLNGRRRYLCNCSMECPYDRRGHAPYGVWARYDDGMIDRRVQQRRKEN